MFGSLRLHHTRFCAFEIALLETLGQHRERGGVYVGLHLIMTPYIARKQQLGARKKHT